MSQLVTFYETEAVDLKGKAEIVQLPMASAAQMRSTEGAIRPGLVYVQAPSAAGAVLIPFGEYDEWSLRDRYNEALRIMSDLGASMVTCETFREVTVRRNLRSKLGFRKDSGGGEATQQRVENSNFDYKHSGTGGAPRDPRPLRWPDEPGFAAAVNNVLVNGVTDVTIKVRSSQSHTVDGNLGIRLKGIGFDLGGTSERIGATSLRIRAIFPPPLTKR